MVKYITRPSFVLMRKKQIPEEIFEESVIFTNLLFGIVPIDALEQVFDEASQSQTSSFAPNGFDLKNKWLEIEARDREAKRKLRLQIEKENPVLTCLYKNLHVNKLADVKLSLFEDMPDSLAPCQQCRPQEFVKWRKTQNALYGEHRTTPIEIKAKTDREPESIKRLASPILKPEVLTPTEAGNLRDEYNRLICELYPDKETRDQMCVEYDEGGECFRHRRGMTGKLYFPKDIRKQIDICKNILATREMERI